MKIYFKTIITYETCYNGVVNNKLIKRQKGDIMTEHNSVILQIKSLFNTFNATDKKIAEYIFEYPKDLINSTISQVSESTEVSEATIFRFCKKIGFKGFQDLKIALALEFDDGVEHYADEKISVDDDQKTTIAKVFNANVNAINDTFHSLNMDDFEKAISMILNAREIVFVGSGGSSVVASDAHHKFIRTGLKVSTYSDYHLQLMALSQLSEDDLVIVISHTGSNLNMLSLLDVALDNNVKTIGITSYKKSPINDKVDVALNAVSQETKYQFEAFASRISHLSIIDALYISVRLQRKEETDEAINKMRHAISETRM